METRTFALMSAGLWALLLVLPIVSAPAGATPAIDPHALFEARCLRCHGHAGAFAREQLRLDGDAVFGKSLGRDINAFILRHQGRLTHVEANALYDAFRRQLNAGGLFETRCRACHRRAYELARLELIIAADRLIGRYSGRDMAVFLAQHGSRTNDEAEVLFDMLLWHRRTIEAAHHDE